MTREELIRLTEALTRENIRLKADKAAAERRVAQLTEMLDEIELLMAYLTERIEYLEGLELRATLGQSFITEN